MNHDYDPTSAPARTLEALAERLGPDSFAAALHKAAIKSAKARQYAALFDAAVRPERLS